MNIEKILLFVLGFVVLSKNIVERRRLKDRGSRQNFGNYTMRDGDDGSCTFAREMEVEYGVKRGEVDKVVKVTT